jgi:uncharacterized protein involved in type VI secretion and phage assembly
MVDNKRVPGVVVGLVENVEDPESIGRIKVKYPWLSGEPISAWCRLVSPMAGDEHGFFFAPEVGSEALIAFNQGNFDEPYIIGYMWNKDTALPGTDLPQRIMKSVSGNLIILDDTEGDEGIRIEDKHGNSIVMNQEGIAITSASKISIEASGELKAVGDPIQLNP